MKKGIIATLSMVFGASAGLAASGVVQNKKTAKHQDDVRKLCEFYDLLIQWLSIKQENRSLETYLLEKGYKTVAIYGMKELGERLYDELKDSKVEVKYAIDKNADNVYADVDVLTPDDSLEEVDAIIVTAIHYYDEIEEMLEERMDCPILSLEDIVYDA